MVSIAVTLTAGGRSATASVTEMSPWSHLGVYSGRVCDVAKLFRTLLPGAGGSMRYVVSYAREDAFGRIVPTTETRDYTDQFGTDLTYSLILTPADRAGVSPHVSSALKSCSIECRIHYRPYYEVGGVLFE